MPNYSLQVDNSRYYDPTLRNTLQAYADAQEQDMRTVEAGYGEMTSKANMLEKLANDVKGKDSVAYQNYMNYANALRQHTDLLATQGLNPSVWKNIIQAKNDYSRIIHPIEEAYQAREKEAQRQAEYMKQHPGAVFERNAYNMGIDQWMKNPHYTAQVIDKETIANRAKERFAALKTQLMEFVSQNGGLDAIMTKNPDAVKRWFKAKAPWLYESMYKTGANPEDVKKLLAGDPEMENSMLQGIVNDTVRMSGIDSWNTDYDHYTAEQNAQNRQNLFDQIYTSVRGEAPNAIGETKFDKYDDKISANLMMEKARLEETIRHNKAIEDAANDKGGGGRNKDKWGHYWETTQSTTDVSNDAKKVVEEAKDAQQKRIFITAQPELAKCLTTDDWNDILEDIKDEYQLGSIQNVDVSYFINDIIAKAQARRESNISDYKYWKDVPIAHRPSKSRQEKYNPDGTLNSAHNKTMVDDHESYLDKNVRSLYKNGKTPEEDEVDIDEVLANLATFDNTRSVISDLSDDDAKNDFSAFKRQADATTDNVDDRRNKNFFINLDTGQPYAESALGTSQDDLFELLDAFESSDGKDNKVTGRNWGRTIRYDKNGNAHLAIRFKSSKGWKTVGYQPDIYGSETLNQTAQDMLNILTESNNILRSKTATKANKEKAKINKEKAIAAIGVLNAISKDEQTKQFRIGYDGEIPYTEQDIINIVDNILTKQE